jgi:hypothetical protein
VTVPAIVLSKDRPAQLQLLLDSLQRNAPGVFAPTVIWTSRYPGYNLIDRQGAAIWNQSVFRGDVLDALRDCDDGAPYTCFFCDDDILYRPLTGRPWVEALADERTLCYSLRLGANTIRQYPSGLAQMVPWPVFGNYPAGDPEWFAWPWHGAVGTVDVELDFAYPGSIDGHLFRTQELRAMLTGRDWDNPTALECALMAACLEDKTEQRPAMACGPRSVLVGNPVNRVSEQSNVRHGATYPVTAAELNERWLDGQRLDFDAIDFSAVDGAHAEVELKWRKP